MLRYVWQYNVIFLCIWLKKTWLFCELYEAYFAFFYVKFHIVVEIFPVITAFSMFPSTNKNIFFQMTIDKSL